MMHAWGAVDLRNYLAKKNHGYSILAQSYEFCPRLIQLDILDFTLSHKHEICVPQGLHLNLPHWSQSHLGIFLSLSSPVHPVSEFRGGGLSVKNERTDERTEKI